MGEFSPVTQRSGASALPEIFPADPAARALRPTLRRYIGQQSSEVSWQRHSGQAVALISHSMASVREVKKRLVRDVLFTAKTKLAMTLSTGEAPSSATCDAWQGRAKAARAPRLTRDVVAMSTSRRRLACPQSSLTMRMAASASLVPMAALRAHVS